MPWIILQRRGSFRRHWHGEESQGTKVFALAGKIKKGGLVEVPMGLPIKDIIFGIGGGIKNDKAFKAVQMGGPSGGCIPAELADTTVDYESIPRTGAIVGSGGMIVMDEDTCMVDMARFFLDFTRKESCGKCNYCRIGTKRMLEILERITRGEGRDGDIETAGGVGRQNQGRFACAVWARLHPTRSSPPCATSETSMRTISIIRSVPPTPARP